MPETNPTIDRTTGLLTSRCIRCGAQLWQRNGLWADSPVKGMSGGPLVVNMICPAKGQPLKHVPEV